MFQNEGDRLMRKLVLGIGLLAMGCATEEPFTYGGYDPPSAKEKTMILSSIKDMFIDPVAIRDAEISQRTKIVFPDIGEAPYIICVRLNPKNQLGEYAGAQSYAFYFDDKETTVRLDSSACPGAYSGVQYSPFPEAEHL